MLYGGWGSLALACTAFGLLLLFYNWGNRFVFEEWGMPCIRTVAQPLSKKLLEIYRSGNLVFVWGRWQSEGDGSTTEGPRG